MARRLTLGFLLAVSGAAAQDLAEHLYLDREYLAVLRALLVDGFVVRRSLPARLHDFLEARLRVDWSRAALEVHLVADGIEDEFARNRQSAVDGDCANHGFEQGRQVGGTLAAAGRLFALAQQQELTEAKTTRKRRQAIPAHEVAAPLGEVALVALRAIPEQALCHDVAEDRVAEKLEALVGFKLGLGELVHVGTVDKSLAQHVLALELDAETRLDCLFERGHQAFSGTGGTD